MWEQDLGPVRLSVEHRSVGGDRGGTLCIRERTPEARERLRFDCFELGPHFHYDPPGRNAITRLHPDDDPIAWTVGELGRDFEGYLKRAGLELERPIDRSELAAVLKRVEAELRCPPADLDDLDLEGLRRRQGEKWRLYGDDVLAAWVADMDFPVAEPIQRAFRDLVRRSDFGYPVNPSLPGLPTLFCERMEQRFGWAPEPRLVEVMTDVVQGIFVALRQLADRDEGAVVQTPIYPPFLGALGATGRRLVENPLVPGPDRFELDLDGLRTAIDAGTRLLLFCNPHNPSGRVFTRSELERVAEIALERDLIVISDEIHADLVYPGHTHIPFATLSPEVEARTVTLTSATKAFNVAGMRCSVVAFGSRELKRRFLPGPDDRHVHGGANTWRRIATSSCASSRSACPAWCAGLRRRPTWRGWTAALSRSKGGHTGSCWSGRGSG
jgi:bifunctional pyridoxal-dependent enzyme with beta-cystathionase and maltose regulon repressor activities